MTLCDTIVSEIAYSSEMLVPVYDVMPRRQSSQSLPQELQILIILHVTNDYLRTNTCPGIQHPGEQHCKSVTALTFKQLLG
jgi:hypothetical protein